MSASKICLDAFARVNTVRNISKIGIPRTTNGNKIVVTAVPCEAESSISAARINPSNIDPVSPMKTFAGWKLNLRKASVAPMVIRSINTDEGPSFANLLIKRKADMMNTEPAASPSSPSNMLIAFMTIAIATIVMK